MIADIVVIAIMLLCIFLGYKRGLIKVSVRILGFLVALIIAFILYTPISNYIINNTDIVNNLEETIQNKLYTEEEGEDPEVNENFISTMEKYIENYADEMKENSSEYIAKGLAIAIVRGGTWIGLFIIARIAMIFIKIFASIIENIPIIKQFNKAGGTIYGILEGFLIIYAMLAIINLTAPMIEHNKTIEEIQNSHICKTMYENNLLLKIIL